MNEVLEELRVALFSIWHRRWLALGVAWVVCLLGWLAVALVPNSYEAKARIYVDLQDVLSEQMKIAGSGRQEIMRVRQTLVSSVNLEKVIRATSLGNDIKDRRLMESAIESLSNDVEVISQDDNLFELSASIGESGYSDAENAMLARDVVQKLLDIFRESNISGNRSQIAGSMLSLDKMLEERKRELEAAEKRRLEFEAQYPDLVGGSETLAEKIKQARTEMRALEGDVAAAQSALAAIDGQIASTAKTISIGSGGLGAMGSLARMQATLAQLRGRGFTEQHPDVISTKNQVEFLKKQVSDDDSNFDSGQPNPAYTQLVSIKAEKQADVQAMTVRKAAIEAELNALLESQASEPEIAAKANQITRDYDVLRTKYQKLLSDREEIRLRGEVDNEVSAFKFDVIDPPVIPRSPVAPNRPLLLFGVLFVGCVAGAGAAFAMSQIRATFSTSSKLERIMGIPVAGTISLTIKETSRALEAKRLKQWAGASGALVAVFFVLLVIEFLQVRTVA